MKNDKLVQDEEFAALTEQDKSALAYEIVNLFEKDGVYRDRLSMREDPPSLVITDSEGSQVEFKLTEDFTAHLASSLNQVNKAYHGYRKHTPKELREMSLSKRIEYEFRNRTMRFVITVLSLLIIVGLIILKVIGG